VSTAAAVTVVIAGFVGFQLTRDPAYPPASAEVAASFEAEMPIEVTAAVDAEAPVEVEAPSVAPEVVSETAVEIAGVATPDAEMPEIVAEVVPELEVATEPASEAEVVSVPASETTPELETAPEPIPDGVAALPSPPEFDVVRIEADGGALVAGRAQAGSALTLRLDGQEIEAMRADSGGSFVTLLTLSTSAVPRVLSLEMAMDDGSIIAAEQTVIIAPLTPPVAVAALETPVETAVDAPADVVAEVVTPQAAEPTTSEATAVATAEEVVPEVVVAEVIPAAAPTILIADADGVRVVQTAENAEAPEAKDQLVLDTIAYDTTGDVILSGRGEAETDVQVYLDNQPVQATTVNEAGNWRAALADVEPGTYTLRVDEIGAGGEVISRIETPFQREDQTVLDALPASATGVSVITVQPGFTLWGIAREAFGEGVLYVRVFEANQELIGDPDLIYPGQVFIIPDN
jgi:nucleoid-associated protein YgaU